MLQEMQEWMFVVLFTSQTNNLETEGHCRACLIAAVLNSYTVIPDACAKGEAGHFEMSVLASGFVWHRVCPD